MSSRPVFCATCRQAGWAALVFAMALFPAVSSGRADPVAAAPAENAKPSLVYPLERGYVRHWLVAGPQVERVADVSPFQGANDDETKRAVWRHFYRPERDLAGARCEGEEASWAGGKQAWQYVATDDDRLVTFSRGGGCIFLRAWAFAAIEVPAAVEGEWEAGSFGPVDVWVNGEQVLHSEELSIFLPTRRAFRAALRAGRNEVLVRFETVKIRVGGYGMNLRLPEAAAGASVVLPTALPETGARLAAEKVIGAAWLDREIFTGGDPVSVRWSDTQGRSAPIVGELVRANGEVLARRETTGQTGVELAYGRADALAPGRYTIRLSPAAIADPKVRESCTVSLALAVRPAEAETGRTQPYATFERRQREMLEKAAGQEGLNAEIAKMKLGRWHEVRSEPFLRAVDKLNHRNDTSDFEMTALLGAMLRHGGDPAFPAELKGPLEDCILGFKYWADEPGKDVMWFWSENHQIAFHASEIMAGQLYPDRTFTNAGQTGRWHLEKGNRLTLDWLRRRATRGFHEWDSNTYFYIDLLALSHLADLAADPEVRHLSSVVLSKMLLQIALNSYQGVFGSTHGRTYPGEVKSGRSEGTSGASWLMWGLGSNGYTSLALMDHYRLPPVIARIATARPVEFWSRERHGATLDPAVDYFSGSWEINKVTYRTSDYMLCSAQDCRAGERGNMQHIWQATLGPDQPVFVNHPPFMAESGSPNFWVGNLVLPRVAQWKDALIGVYHDAKGQGMGFTHAYFPLHAFDEWRKEGRWILARKGEGYVALTSAAGPEIQQSGRYAFREIRSYANEDIWICQLGSKRQDGDFAAFCAKVGALPLEFAGLAVKFTSLRGDRLSFGWEGPFRKNGEDVPLKDFPHYDNPYLQTPFPATSLSLRCEDERVDLTWPADRIKNDR